jgi:hypothetical protein
MFIDVFIDLLSSDPDLFRWMVGGLWVSVGILFAALALKENRDEYNERSIWLGDALLLIVAWAFFWPISVLLRFPHIRIRLD